MRRFDVYQTITLIRRQFAISLRSQSLIRLGPFLNGCFYLSQEHGIECRERPASGGLHKWVAKGHG